jgi:hypothetical protein
VKLDGVRAPGDRRPRYTTIGIDCPTERTTRSSGMLLDQSVHSFPSSVNQSKLILMVALNTSPEPSLTEDERLDAIDPLRHLCSADDSELLPPQSPSLGGQIIQINIEAPQRCSKESHRTITLSLAVDARPGCGGIAWPAGEVRSCILHVAYHHIYHMSFITSLARAHLFNVRHL